MHHARLYQLTFLPLILFVAGCGASALGTAKTTVVAAGQVWMQADAQFAPLYEQARIDARENSDSWEERDGSIAKWEKGRDALVAAGFALKSAALAIAIAEDGHSTDWIRRTACAVEALRAAEQSLAALDIDFPGLSKVFEISQQLVGTCKELNGSGNYKIQGP